MTNEERERIKRIEQSIEFILEHQAKFSADIGEIKETAAKHNEAIVGLLQISRTLIDHQTAAEAQMGELRSEMKSLTSEMKTLGRAQIELFQAQRAGEERLDGFITFVEKYISSRNGGEVPH